MAKTDSAKPKSAVYDSRPIKPKRARRTKAAIMEIKDQMMTLATENRPMTVRQMFYQASNLKLVDKSEQGYGTIGRLLGDLRKSGRMPFDWIADNTRWQRKPRSYSSLADMLEQQQHFYRRALWESQDAYVEIWLEKEALAGVLYDVTAKWDVPLMVCRGYPSLSFIHGSAEVLENIGKPIYLYYFGDHDPSGVDIPRFVEESLRKYSPDAEIYFERVAVLPHQIESMGLPSRPTKKTDTRSKSFVGESVEVDAIPPAVLRQMVEECITRHIDPEQLQRTRQVESAERETLTTIFENFGDY